MNNEIVPFDFRGTEVRTLAIEGEPWFVAKDVAEVLGYTWNGSARVSHIPEEWKGVTSVVTDRGSQELITISEPGLFFFLGRSDKPAALPMQKWVAGEVLPTIRKTGGVYMTSEKAEEILADPDLIIGLANQVKSIKAERDEAIRTKAQISDKKTASETTYILYVCQEPYTMLIAYQEYPSARRNPLV